MRGHTWDIVDALISVSCKTDVVKKKADRDIRSKGPCHPETILSPQLSPEDINTHGHFGQNYKGISKFYFKPEAVLEFKGKYHRMFFLY